MKIACLVALFTSSLIITTRTTTAFFTSSSPSSTFAAPAAFVPRRCHNHHGSISKSSASLPKTCNTDRFTALFANDDNNWNSGDNNDNQWKSSDDEDNVQRSISNKNNDNDDDDWQRMLQTKQDGSFWSSFEPSNDDEAGNDDANSSTSKRRSAAVSEEEESEAWLDVVAMLSAEEVEFNQKDAQRADLARQMEEWQFDAETIASALGVATDMRLESIDEVAGMQTYREEAFMDQVDMETVESHTQVEIDDETGEPMRQQMVYVDEHTCIGCTNCASIAQSTFFMHGEHGRARVFQQWGDDDETIQIAIETCPVDCIHYIPYDELVTLEKERRYQNINPKGRLVSQAENGNSLSHFGGGAVRFTAPQLISGNMKSRCSNCPSRGCQDCPMFGVGKNPEFERKEKLRKERRERRKVQAQREAQQKLADL